jgi:hypothetical protein
MSTAHERGRQNRRGDPELFPGLLRTDGGGGNAAMDLEDLENQDPLLQLLNPNELGTSLLLENALSCMSERPQHVNCVRYRKRFIIRLC